MKGKFKKLFLFSFVFILIINTFMLFGVEASETSTYVLENPNGTTQYEISFAQDTYYSGKSEDDAWYQAAVESYENKSLTGSEISLEFDTFCRRDIELIGMENTEFEERDGVLVQGYLNIESQDSNKSLLALRNIRVDLYKKDLIGSTKIATTYTDDLGKYMFRYNDKSVLNNQKYKILLILMNKMNTIYL